jgi:hypothetical protein
MRTCGVRDLLVDYSRTSVRFDEMLDPGDQPRAHWTCGVRDLLGNDEDLRRA